MGPDAVSLVLFRVDERLLHGQVLVGWGTHLEIRDYVVVDDALAASSWEQELYESALSDDDRAEFLTVEGALARIPELADGPRPAAVLTRDTATMRRLAVAGALEGRRVNVGGLHDAPGRRKVLDYVWLGEDERRDLAEIATHGARVSARDLPTAPEVPLDELLAS